MRLIVMILFLFAAPVGSMGQEGSSPPRPSPRVVRFLGERAAGTLAAATRVEVFRVSSTRAEEDEPSLGGYKVVATAAEQGEPFARRLAAVLLDEKTYRFDTNKVGGFTPFVGLRVWKGGDAKDAVEVLLSFQTDELVVFSPNPNDRSIRSAQEDFDPARAVLVTLAKEALPEDRDVQALTPARATPRP